MRRILTAVFLAFVFTLMGCGSSPSTSEPNCSAGGDTPTTAYKRLFDAVKSKNTAAIKAELTKGTIALGEMTIERYKKTPEAAYENGFTKTTFAPSLPEIRDQRINCNMGAIEVWSVSEQQWEDIPFMIEDGKWKLAYGEAFGAKFKSPGKGLATKEAEAANAARGNVPMPTSNVNTNKIVNMSIPSKNVDNSSNRK